MQGLVNVGNKEHLLHLLNIVENAAHSDTIDEEDEKDETISNKDSKIDEIKVNLNASGIKDIYVSLIIP